MQNTREKSSVTKEQRDHVVGHRYGTCLPRLWQGPGAAASGAAATQPTLLRGNHETISHHTYKWVPEGHSPLLSRAACCCEWGPSGTKHAAVPMQLCNPSFCLLLSQPWARVGPKSSIVTKQL